MRPHFKSDDYIPRSERKIKRPVSYEQAEEVLSTLLRHNVITWDEYNRIKQESVLLF